MKRLIVLILCVVFTPTFPCLAQDGQTAPYAGLEDWSADKDQRLQWWREARFGLFIHWGLYSAAGGRWDNKDYSQDYAEWIQHWAKVPSDQYAAALKPQFNPKPGFASRWADLAKRAGVKYAVLTTKHHEGFTLFNSTHPDSVDNPVTGGTNISPKGRDLVREYAEAFRKRDLKVGFYYSLLDWRHPNAYTISLPLWDQQKRDHQPYVDYIRHHFDELAGHYGPIALFWPDYSNKDAFGDEIQGVAWGTRAILQNIRTKQPQILTNNRFWIGLENKNGDFATPEKYVPPTGIPDLDWEVCHTMNESFGFSFHDQNWKTTEQTVHLLIDIVSKGGNLLLNVGPTADGDIPPQAIELLEGVGEWMNDYSEAIYGTTASPFAELSFDGRVTAKALPNGNTRLYLHVFTWPKDGALTLNGLNNEVLEATLLPQRAKLNQEQENGVLRIALPNRTPNAIASVIAVDIQGSLNIESH